MDRREWMMTTGAAGLAIVGRDATAAEHTGQELPTGPARLTGAELNKLPMKDGLNPARLYGHQLEFTGTILAIGKGLDGGRVRRVQIDDWDPDLYGTVMVHNLAADGPYEVGKRFEMTGLIVAQSYGRLFPWHYHSNPIGG